MRTFLKVALAGVASAVVIALAPATAEEDAATVPNLSGPWQRANENLFVPGEDQSQIKGFDAVRFGSMYFPAPGAEGGKPIEFLHTDNDQQVVGDDKSPILLPWTAAQVKKNGDLERQDKYVPTAHGTCWPSGVPEVLNLREPVQLLQEKDKITIIYQRDAQYRTIWLNRAHSAHPPLTWYGDSVGHYEGDALVVDTIAQAAKPLSVVDPFGTPHSDKIHVVERYRITTDKRGKRLDVTFTVEDPGAFTMPWSGMVAYRPSRDPVSEVICAENDRSFGDDSLLGAIPEDDHPVF